MRILQVITDTDRRGAQVFATDLGAALAERGHAVRTVALTPGHSDTRLAVEVLGDTALGLGTLRALRSASRDVDVVCAHGSSTLPACSIAGLGGPTPFVYRQISDSLFWAPTRRRRLRVRAGMGRAARIVALSQGSAEVLRTSFGVPETKLDQIPNGVPRGAHRPADRSSRVEARRGFGLPADAPVAAVISALVPEKGVDVAVAAVPDVADLRLVVAGDGPEAENLKRMAEDVASGRITFTGSVADPGPVYASADVVLLPSRGGDTMPATLIEAGMRALPVVATDVGAISEVVEDGRTGVVLPESDPDDLAATLRGILADPTRLEAMGRAAEVRCVERYEIGVVAAAWEATLTRVAPTA